jgi:hypothetical protein
MACRLGNGVTELLLRNGEFVACVYRGLADEYAMARATVVAAKVIKAARKKFSKLTLKVFDREISAWDYFCYSQHVGGVAGADKFISDFIRIDLVERLEGMPKAEINLLALADVPIDAIDEDTRIEPQGVFRRVQGEVLRLAGEHGRTLVIEGLPGCPKSALAPMSLAPPISN